MNILRDRGTGEKETKTEREKDNQETRRTNRVTEERKTNRVTRGRGYKTD